MTTASPVTLCWQSQELVDKSSSRIWSYTEQQASDAPLTEGLHAMATRVSQVLHSNAQKEELSLVSLRRWRILMGIPNVEKSEFVEQLL